MYYAKQKGRRLNLLSAIYTTCAAAVVLICGGCGGSGRSVGVPTPVASYVARSDSLGFYFSTIQNFQDQDSFTFSDTGSAIYTPDPGSYSQVAETTTSTVQLFDGGINVTADLIFNHKVHLSKTTIRLPKSGAIQVMQETRYETNAIHPDTSPKSYSYFTISRDGLTKTVYGFDWTWERHKVTGTRYDPGIVIPLSLSAGSSYTETYTEYSNSFSYADPEAVALTSYDVTAMFNLKVLPSLTVPVGTFTNVGELQFSKSYTVPLGFYGSLTSTPVVDTEVFDLSESAGIIQINSTVVTQNVLVTLNPGLASVLCMSTNNDLSQLTNATIAGKQYGTGRSVRSNSTAYSHDDPQPR